MGIDHEAVYTALDGRSVWRVLDYELAPIATFYRRDGLAGNQAARLVLADGRNVAGANVQLIATQTNGTEVFNGNLLTDGAGIITLPALPPGLYVVHIDFSGAGTSAASSTSFTMTVV